MRDWRAFVGDRLASVQLPESVYDEICTEIANHLEDRFEHCMALGRVETDAEREALSSIPDWEFFARELVRERKATMTTIGKQFILPSGVALGLATLTLAFEIRFGPRPAVLITGMGAFVVYRLWLFALVFTGAASAWLSAHAGASKGRRALVAITPALYMLGAMLCVVITVTAMNLLNVSPLQHIYYMALVMGVANWVALPGVALLIGASPFLGAMQVGQRAEA